MSKKRDRDKPPAEPKVEPAPKLLNPALATGLKAMRDEMAVAKAAAAKAAEAKRQAAEARGERVAPAPKPAAVPAAKPAKPRTPEVWRPDLDKDLLNIAMSGVVPLGQKVRREGAKPAPSSGPVNTRMKRAQAEGDEAIGVRWLEDGSCEGARKGRTFALAALGRFAVPQDSLDLHGKDPAEARTAVAEFVRSRRARGLRTVCVVHGQGKHAPDGTSALREAVVRALSEAPGSREVDAFRTAEATNGGAGAILVALRHG